MTEQLKSRVAESAALLRRITAQVKPLDDAIAATDWALIGDRDEQDGVWRSTALEKRHELQFQRSALMPEFNQAKQEHDELSRSLAERERAEREAEERRQFSATTRPELLRAVKDADEAVQRAEAAVTSAALHLAGQRLRVDECNAAVAAVAPLHLEMQKAQQLAWLNRTAAAETVERVAVEAHQRALENANRAIAVLPLLDEEVSRAEAALQDAETGASAAKQRFHAARVRVEVFDINAAVRDLGSKVDSLRAIDPNAARRLCGSLRDGLVIFNHRDQLVRPDWLARTH